MTLPVINGPAERRYYIHTGAIVPWSPERLRPWDVRDIAAMPCLRLDAVGREIAAQRIAHPEPWGFDRSFS